MVNDTPAAFAAALYFSRSAGVSRRFSRTEAGSASLGLPLGAFGGLFHG